MQNVFGTQKNAVQNHSFLAIWWAHFNARNETGKRDRNYKNQGTKTGGGNQKYGFVRAYKAANNTYWVPARSIWNQFAYFNVNVNDDLTIPQYQQPHQLRFAQECNLFTTSKPSFSLNKFLNQSPKINFCGNFIKYLNCCSICFIYSSPRLCNHCKTSSHR